MPLEYKIHVLTMTKLEHDRKQRSNNNAAGGAQVSSDQRISFNELVQWQSQVAESEYERLNKCSVCMCELFPDPFASTTISQLADQQEFLIQARFEGA